MSTNDQHMPADGEPALPAPVTREVPVVTVPPVVISPADSSNYPHQRGSAAAVDPSTPGVAAQKAKTDVGARPTRRRGASSGGKLGHRSRSRSEEDKATARAKPGLENHVQLLQAQVL